MQHQATNLYKKFPSGYKRFAQEHGRKEIPPTFQLHVQKNMLNNLAGARRCIWNEALPQIFSITIAVT